MKLGLLHLEQMRRTSEAAQDMASAPFPEGGCARTALDKFTRSILPELARHAGRGEGSAAVVAQQTALRTRQGEEHPVVLALALEPALVAARRGAGRGMYTAGSACRA